MTLFHSSPYFSQGRTQVRKMQRQMQKDADKEAAKKMCWPKSMRQYSSRYGQGAEMSFQTLAQLGDEIK